MEPLFAETVSWLVYGNMMKHVWHLAGNHHIGWVQPLVSSRCSLQSSHESSNSGGRTTVVESRNFTLNVLGLGIVAVLTAKCVGKLPAHMDPLSHTLFSSRAFLWPAIVPVWGLDHWMDREDHSNLKFQYVSGDADSTWNSTFNMFVKLQRP